MDLSHDKNKLPLTNTSQTRLHKCRLLEPTPDRKDEKRLFQDSYVLWHQNFDFHNQVSVTVNFFLKYMVVKPL